MLTFPSQGIGPRKFKRYWRKKATLLMIKKKKSEDNSSKSELFCRGIWQVTKFLQTIRNKYVRGMIESMKGLPAWERLREWWDLVKKWYKENWREEKPKSLGKKERNPTNKCSQLWKHERQEKGDRGETEAKIPNNEHEGNTQDNIKVMKAQREQSFSSWTSSCAKGKEGDSRR